MELFKLYSNGDKVYRLLAITNQSQNVVIDCLRERMPFYEYKENLKDFYEISEEKLAELTGVSLPDFDSLDNIQKKVARERYQLISSQMAFLDDSPTRYYITSMMAKKNNMNASTINRYFRKYLIYWNLAALVPHTKIKEKELTKDQKNFRWALNLFYYTYHKYSIPQAYARMLKERYTDENGLLVEGYPKLHQFVYFYKRTKKVQNQLISREGLSVYQRNNRPLLGDGVKDFAPTIGWGMIDGTILDIYCVNESGQLVGRPYLTACVDAFSGMCLGYSLGWEGGSVAVKSLLNNVISDKNEWCNKFNIKLEKDVWNVSNALPHVLVTDRGKEFTGYSLEHLSDLGVQITNLPPFRPELKGPIEKFFDLIQSSYKNLLIGKGVVRDDFNERGVADYRLGAQITLEQLEKIIIHAIIAYNSTRIVKSSSYSDLNIEPHPNALWNKALKTLGNNLIKVDKELLDKTLLPRTKAQFTRRGLIVNKLRYNAPGFNERMLSDDKVVVAYNPDNVSTVWLFENGDYTQFSLIDSDFLNKRFEEVDILIKRRNKKLREAEPTRLQGQIDLQKKIEEIVGQSNQKPLSVKNVRETRKNEIKKKRIKG